MPRPKGGDENIVEDELDDKVEEVYPGEGDLENTHGPDGVEEDLEGAEEGLAQDGVEDDGLDGCRKISVEAVNAKRLVMGQMVGLLNAHGRQQPASAPALVDLRKKGEDSL